MEMDAARRGDPRGALWARVVTPTSEVRQSVYQAAPPTTPPPRPRAEHPSTDASLVAGSGAACREPGHMPRSLRIVALLLLLVSGAVPSAVAAAPPRPVAPEWGWPLESATVSEPFVAPPGPYGPGHRGIDLAPHGSTVVRAPAAGTVAFAGRVADRGVLTIDHGDGLVSSYEPVAPSVSAGTRVARGDAIATVDAGGHTAPGDLHLGLRRDRAYVNPLLLIGEVPRAVLLPCCAPLAGSEAAESLQARGWASR